MKVQLVPYGNAQVFRPKSLSWTLFFFLSLICFLTLPTLLSQESYDGKEYHFTCQHGEEECLGNMIEVRLSNDWHRQPK